MKKTTKILIIISFAILFIIASFITIVLANSNNDDKSIEKAEANIRYLDSVIITMANNLNNISVDSNVSFLNKSNFTIDWIAMEDDLNKLYISWNSIIIDFNNLNINNTDLTNFGKKLDEMGVSIKNQNKNLTLTNLNSLYKLLVQYANSIDVSNELKNEISSKYYLLTAYSLVESNNWSIVSDNLTAAEQAYYKNIGIIENSSRGQFEMEKIYVAIKELENITLTKDVDLFYLKYRIVILMLDVRG